jgi:hypothetical protein
MTCALVALAAGFVLGACRGPEIETPGGKPDAARGSTTVLPPTTAAPASSIAPPAPPAPTIATAQPGSMYVCVVATAGETRQTTIELTPAVAQLCRKAPEMGPCQYERATCRRNGGRVFTVDGVEITLQTEAEYDKRVMRVRMKSN